MSEKHSNFIEYMSTIIHHDNYKTQPCRFNYKGKITWVKTKKSCPKRAEWWDKRVIAYGLINRADVARYIHPKDLNGMKPCSECGKKMSIFYIYPSKNLLTKINKFFLFNYTLYHEDIYDIIHDLLEKREGIDVFDFFSKSFNIKEIIDTEKSLVDYLLQYHTHDAQKGKMLSPGVMSNAPDRFDGFHTYNACCRKEKDKGRHDENMKNYSRDRRAFENWADGNFTLANQVMGEFAKYTFLGTCPACKKNKKMTADHIGPISLGFSHRKEFNPLCSSCNSGKNNRMTLKDIEDLLDAESRAITIISWHSKFIWDKLKFKISSDEEAKKLSTIMRENMHYVLASLNIIYQYPNGYDFLLTKLHPEYVQYKYKISNFNPLMLDKIIIVESVSTADTKVKSEQRYLEISFEELEKYTQKKNRIYNEKLLEEYSNNFTKIKGYLCTHQFSKVDRELRLILQSISSKLEEKFLNL